MRHTGLWGWILFLFSAVAFTLVGVRDGDVPMIVGSVLFFIACLLFLAPYVRR